jgi:hypothetical protein
MSFSADIEQFVLKSEKRLEAVIKTSIDDVTKMAQTTTSDGGKMRLVTGFLRWTGRASLEGFPSGPNIRPKDAQINSFTYNGDEVAAVLLKMKLGDTFYFGWTANYAAARELHDGFLETAVQNWQQFINANSEKYRGK